MENLTRYNIICEFALYNSNLIDRVVNLSWLFIWTFCSSCATRKITVFAYTTTTYEVHNFKNENKRELLLRDIFLLFSHLYLFIHSCKFGAHVYMIEEIDAHETAHDVKVMRQVINHYRVSSKAATDVL